MRIIFAIHIRINSTFGLMLDILHINIVTSYAY